MTDDPHALTVTDLTIVRPDGGLLMGDVSFGVGPAELVLLVGASGSGKSTLLLLLGGLLDTEPGEWTVSGRLACGGRDIDLSDEPSDVGGVVFQNYALFDDLDARENLRIAMDHAPPGGPGLTEELAAILADIDPRQPVSACSGGQRQRLAIVRTVLANQPVLLFDEPNSGLDIVSSRRLIELIRRLCRIVGKPTLIAVHHFSELLPLADRVLVIDPHARRLIEVPPDAAAVEAGLGAAPPKDDAPIPANDPEHWTHSVDGGTAAPWFARYLAGYFWLLCATPMMILYVAAGACIIGFVTVWFGFNYYSFGGLLRSMLHDETLVGLGAVQSRVAIPLIANLLFVARNCAVIAADVGNRAASSQFQAMANLNIPGRRYVFSAILISMTAGSLLYLVLSLLLGGWAAQETWHVHFPDQYRGLFRVQYFRLVLDSHGWPLPAMGWVVVKTTLSAFLAGGAAILVALGAKPDNLTVSRTVANAIVAGVIVTMIVHAAASVIATR